MSKQVPVSVTLFNRLMKYLNYLKQEISNDELPNTSATIIAEALGLNDVQVRKDLALVSDGGKPKVGYVKKDLIEDLEHFLGHDNCSEAVLVGVGNLGKALLTYKNFEKYGLNIVMAFDTNEEVIGTKINGKEVVSTSKIENLCKRMNIKIGVIAVPGSVAQEVCDMLIAGGIRAIWNFAPINLKVADDIVIKNEDIAASLAVLTKQLHEKIQHAEEQKSYFK